MTDNKPTAPPSLARRIKPAPDEDLHPAVTAVPASAAPAPAPAEASPSGPGPTVAKKRDGRRRLKPAEPKRQFNVNIREVIYDQFVDMADQDEATFIELFETLVTAEAERRKRSARQSEERARSRGNYGDSKKTTKQ